MKEPIYDRPTRTPERPRFELRDTTTYERDDSVAWDVIKILVPIVILGFALSAIMIHFFPNCKC